MLNRRTFIAGLAVMAAAPAALAEVQKMSVQDAHKAATDGDVLLLDIRTRGEWRQTGIGESALPVSMHESDFLAKLQSLTGGDKTRPVALICAVGGRSQALQRVLTRMGWSRIIDVSEGMMGSRAGPGWLKSGLPVKRFSQ